MNDSLTISNDRLRLIVRRREKQVRVMLEDLSTGHAWGDCPLAILEVYDKMQLRLDELPTYDVLDFQRVEGGVHITLGDPFRQLSVGIWLQLDGGELVVTLPTIELYEHNDMLYRLFAMELFPGLMRVAADGKLILPINTGAICSPKGKPKIADRFLIYGEQERWELLPTLPLCAAHSPSVGGLMALATGVPHDMRCRVETDGNDNGEAGFAVTYRRCWPDPVDPGTRQLRYVPIPKAQDPLVFSAKRLRRHVIEDHHKPTLRQRADECPDLRYLLGAYTMKLFYGCQNQGIMMYGQSKGEVPMLLRTVMTFEEAKQGLLRLHQAGMGKIYTQSTGWNSRGHDGLYPTRFPVEPRFGGERGFRSLIECGKSLGYQMQVHDNQVMAVSASPDFDADTLVHDIYGEPMITGYWGGGITYARWAHALSPEQIEGPMRQIKALGLTGTYYLDGMGNPLYVNYHPRHKGPRSAYASSINRFLDIGRRVFGSVATECGFLYCAMHADMVATAGSDYAWKLCKPEWPITRLLDRCVPLWQLAMHGLVLLENQGLNWKNMMRSVLMGDHPRYEWSTRPGIMPVLDDTMIRQLRAMFDLTINRFGSLQTMELADWQVLADGVEQTRFEDGTEVIADFSRERLIVNGTEVQRPKEL